ncbi:adenylyl-sulfate kinase [bacterium]|nr:adenylyl-sulfate kinase [Verrucomicrobiales bacterium]MDC0311818.1 adenylyl-sulfate kinase [bacterium]
MDNLYPTFDKMLPREAKETLLGQRGLVVWMYGLSGSGKSTLANLLERKLHDEGKFIKVLDGDNIRSGLNNNLGFTDDDRAENIRRVSEVAKLFADSGIITLTSFITPVESLRANAREIIGDDDLLEVYVKASFDACAERDPKGLYAKVKAGEVKNFTGKDSAFEEPEHADIIIETESQTEAKSLETLYQAVISRIERC